MIGFSNLNKTKETSFFYANGFGWIVTHRSRPERRVCS